MLNSCIWHLLGFLLSVFSIGQQEPLDHEEPTPYSHDAHTFALDLGQQVAESCQARTVK